MKDKKEDLLRKIEKLTEKIELLEQEVDYWTYEYLDLERKCSKLEEELKEKETEIEIKIYDVEEFKNRLKIENIFNDKVDKFIDNYMRYYNYKTESESDIS